MIAAGGHRTAGDGDRTVPRLAPDALGVVAHGLDRVGVDGDRGSQIVVDRHDAGAALDEIALEGKPVRRRRHIADADIDPTRRAAHPTGLGYRENAVGSPGDIALVDRDRAAQTDSGDGRAAVAAKGD